jgi:hypothetical protein
MSCNRELYQVRLRIWIRKSGASTEAIDFDEVNVLDVEKMASRNEKDIGCFKSFLSVIEKNKVFSAAVKIDPDPFHSSYIGRLRTAMVNLEILPAAFLYIKRRDLADDVGLPSRIGVYMEKVLFPFVGGNIIILSAQTAEKIGF